MTSPNTNRVYFDHNATSPARPEVIEAVARAMSVIGNASAQHGHGRAARNLISEAREAIGLKLGLVLSLSRPAALKAIIQLLCLLCQAVASVS